MATSKHLELSNFISKTHTNLRNETKRIGPNAAWEQHCANSKVLKEYSQAMLNLATIYWTRNSNQNDLMIKSRINWVYNYCQNYFFQNEIFRQRHREEGIANKMDMSLSGFSDFTNILKLLDVGSCYNPFKAFTCFDVLPIDIAPASDDVYHCDFLNLEYSDLKDKLSANTFDVVVFSLLLEYLPYPNQRFQCCLNAYKLLKFEGLLIIITPDSKHVGANAKIMKSWRFILAQIGFSRIKYEKLSHIHCMAFRKSLRIAIPQRWAKFKNETDFLDQMYIPQDFNDVFMKDEQLCNIEVEDKLELLNELPYFPQ